MHGETVTLIVAFHNLMNPPENSTRHITCDRF